MNTAVQFFILPMMQMYVTTISVLYFNMLYVTWFVILPAVGNAIAKTCKRDGNCPAVCTVFVHMLVCKQNFTSTLISHYKCEGDKSSCLSCRTFYRKEGVCGLIQGFSGNRKIASYIYEILLKRPTKASFVL